MKAIAWSAALLVLFVGLGAGMLQAQATDRKSDRATAKAKATESKPDKAEKKTGLTDVIRKALTKLAGDHKAKLKFEGKEGWCAKWTADGKKHEAFVDADGKLVKSEVELDSADVPEAVRKLATSTFDKDAKVEWVKVTAAKDDKVTYEAEGTKDGKKIDYVIDAEGKKATPEDDDDADEDGDHDNHKADEDDDDDDKAGKGDDDDDDDGDSDEDGDDD